MNVLFIHSFHLFFLHYLSLHAYQFSFKSIYRVRCTLYRFYMRFSNYCDKHTNPMYKQSEMKVEEKKTNSKITSIKVQNRDTGHRYRVELSQLYFENEIDVTHLFFFFSILFGSLYINPKVFGATTNACINLLCGSKWQRYCLANRPLTNYVHFIIITHCVVSDVFNESRMRNGLMHDIELIASLNVIHITCKYLNYYYGFYSILIWNHLLLHMIIFRNEFNFSLRRQ